MRSFRELKSPHGAKRRSRVLSALRPLPDLNSRCSRVQDHFFNVTTINRRKESSVAYVYFSSITERYQTSLDHGSTHFQPIRRHLCPDFMTSSYWLVFSIPSCCHSFSQVSHGGRAYSDRGSKEPKGRVSLRQSRQAEHVSCLFDSVLSRANHFNANLKQLVRIEVGPEKTSLTMHKVLWCRYPSSTNSSTMASKRPEHRSSSFHISTQPHSTTSWSTSTMEISQKERTESWSRIERAKTNTELGGAQGPYQQPDESLREGEREVPAILC